MDGTPPPSLFFFTFHRCASVFFNQYVLARSQRLTQVNYAQLKFSPTGIVVDGFRPEGHLYGPLRLSSGGEVLERLVNPAFEAVCRDRLRACLMIRDPRDVVVSLFFHVRDGTPVPPRSPAAGKMALQREMASELGIDRYVLQKAVRLEDGLAKAMELVDRQPATTVIRYEDMVNDWSVFAERLRDVFALSADSIREGHRESRPREVERPDAHKRSGATGDHRRKLAPETVAVLTEKFRPFLRTFGYLPA